MPELPEVETVVRGLRACLPGRRIVRAGISEVAGDFILLTPPKQFVRAFAGASIANVERYGKHIVIDLAGGRGHYAWIVHLGMTGRLVCEPASTPPPPHTHAWFHLDGGQILRYTDARQFGRTEVVPAGAANGLPPRLRELGPDPLEIGEAEFVSRLRSRSARVKALLLDQRFLRGLGNIYVDESLFRAAIRPAAPACRISRPRAAALWHAIRSVLAEAIEHGGSSISDYVDAGGRAGAFQNLHRVYGRAGEQCVACGAILRRALVAGRGTTFCPRCQR